MSIELQRMNEQCMKRRTWEKTKENEENDRI